MSIKIQINSLEALERLIGGDNELEIEIRNAIVQAFAEKHLKALMPSVAAAEAVIKDHIGQDVREAVRLVLENGNISRAWDNSWQIEPKLRDRIKSAAEQSVISKVKEAVNEVVAKWVAPDSTTMETLINNRVEQAMRPIIDEAVKQRAEDMKRAVERAFDFSHK